MEDVCVLCGIEDVSDMGTHVCVKCYESIIKKKGEMMNKFVFPIILIILDLGAAIFYGIDGNIRKMIYWFAAAILNITVTF